ncbi:MAG TPA: hypothetical protein VF857_07440, partial [Spirochaetota bacterium]
MEKDFLQSLKLEISRKFTLTPYERIAFHKILGIQKSENGIKILIRDLSKNDLVRRSAISILRDTPLPEVTDAFLSVLSADDLLGEEFFDILDHIERNGTVAHAKGVISYISKYIEKTDYIEYICKAIYTLGQIGYDDPAAASYIKKIITDNTMFEQVRVAAIESFTHSSEIEMLEPLLREGNDRIAYAAYRALAGIADREMKKYEATAEDDLFTVMPGQEDRTLLEIRVLLGKMSSHFDDYSRETKAAYIMAMVLCGHREFIVYTMKALTSNDTALVDLTLYVIMSHTDKLRGPDKLLRSLIALPSLTNRDSRIIVEIFVRFFTRLKETKTNMIFRDKIYNYLVVTLDTYFEHYRKTFMIPEIMEKDYLPEVQRVRKLIINRFSPDIKRRIMMYLTSEDNGMLKKILSDISDSVSYISDDEDSSFEQFIEMLYEKDQKSRDISASRITDIDYEKRYLKNRIVRLCEIIARLSVEEASTNLVKMFNYVKKYYDEDIYESVTNTLSILNYPYMLGELEVQLLSGDDAEKKRATRLLPLFSEQRSLNIFLDFVREHAAEQSDTLRAVLSILVKRDVAGNIAANEIAKKILAENKDVEIKRLAVQFVGQCGIEADIEFLNNLFNTNVDTPVKEGIVQAFDCIIHHASEVDMRKTMAYLREFLKDPGIRVRMYACSILLRHGEKEALGTIRDMMVIKNRNIQREIMMVLGNFITTELAFFLVSLLSEDYALSEDIVPLFRYLPPAEMNELDHFIVNIFKKYEGAMYEGMSYGATQKPRSGDDIKNHKREAIPVMMIEIRNFERYFETLTPVEIAIVFRKVYNRMVECIAARSGTLTRSTGGTLIAYFPEVVSAITAASEINNVISDFNSLLLPEYHLHSVTLISISEMDIVNGEIILPNVRGFSILRGSVIEDRVVVLGEASRLAAFSFNCEILPTALFLANGTSLEYREFMSPHNFMVKAETVLAKLKEAELRRFEEQRQIAEGLKAMEPTGRRSKNTVLFANAMDSVGKVIRKDLIDVSRYVGKRSTDRELIRSVDKMLDDAYRHFLLEVSKTI